jgi:hypothetical protein
MFPEGDTTTLGLDCEELFVTPFWGLVGSVGETGFASIGVGGVMKVVGASSKSGGAAGSCVLMLGFRALDLSDVSDCVACPVYIRGGEAWMGSSSTLVSRFFPPNKVPRPPPLVLGLAVSGSSPDLGDEDLRVGVKASLSFPTGDTPRLFAPTSPIFASWIAGSSVEAREFTRVTLAVFTESMVSEAIRGEERVKRPAWDWCGDMPGRLAGGGL